MACFKIRTLKTTMHRKALLPKSKTVSFPSLSFHCLDRLASDDQEAVGVKIIFKNALQQCVFCITQVM